MTSERLRNSRGRGEFNTDLLFQPGILPRSHPEYLLTMHQSKELAQKQPIGGMQKRSGVGRGGEDREEEEGWGGEDREEEEQEEKKTRRGVEGKESDPDAPSNPSPGCDF